MGRIRYRSLTAPVLAGCLALAGSAWAGDGSMTSRSKRLFPLVSGGGGPIVDGDGALRAITGTAGAHTLGSACDGGFPDSDRECWLEPEVEGDPGNTTRFGWFHRLCVIDKTPPTITAPDDLTVEQTVLGGWSVAMNWLDVDPSADPRLQPTAADDIVPRPRVRVRANGVINDLSPTEVRYGGRPMELVSANGPIVFPLGTTRVDLTAIDCGGNTATDFFRVTVVDRLPPELVYECDPIDPSCEMVRIGDPDDPIQVVEIEADSPFGTAIDPPFPAVHEDICDADPVLTSNLCRVCPERVFVDPDTSRVVRTVPCQCAPYNEDFEVDNEYLVTYTSEDFTGNSAQDKVLYRIVDTTPPIVTILNPVIRVEQATRNGTSLGSAGLPRTNISDNSTPTALLTVEKLDGRGVGCVRGPRDAQPIPIPDNFVFPLGQTTLLYLVTDIFGNPTCAEATIEVLDTIKPSAIRRGSLQTLWYSSRQSITYEIDDICDASPDVTVDEEDPDDPVTRQGLLYTAIYDTDDLYTVQFTAEDDSGNITTTDSTVLGIDFTPVAVNFEGIPRTGALGAIDPNDSTTWPAFFDGDLVDTLFSADDDPGRSGVYSGVSQLNMRVDPNTDNIGLLQPVPSWGPIDGTVPPTGPRQVVGVRCSNGQYCDLDGSFKPYLLRKGPHRILIEASDVAGNGPAHPVAAQRGQYFYYFNVFNLILALEQAAAIVDQRLAEAELPADARTLLEGVYKLDANGRRIPLLNGPQSTGWFQMEKQGVKQLIGFSPQRKAGQPGHLHINAYSVLLEWTRRQNDNPDYWGQASHRTLGNVLLFLADINKKLKLVNEFRDMAGVMDNLTRGAIAEFNLYLNYALDIADPDDDAVQADLQSARGHRNAAISSHANESYNQAILDLTNALFSLENGLFSLEGTFPNLDGSDGVQRLEENELLARQINSELHEYVGVTHWNSRGGVNILQRAASRSELECTRALIDPAHPLHQYCIDRIGRFTADGSRDEGGGINAMLTTAQGAGLYLSEIAWMHHLLEFVDYVQMLDKLQGQHVWVRFWQWEIAHLTKFIVDFARDAACRMHLEGRPTAVTPLCANFPSHDLLNEARCRYVTGVAGMSLRDVDDTLRTYAGAKCLMQKTFEEVYNPYVDRDGNLNTRECWDLATEQYLSVQCEVVGGVPACPACPDGSELSQRYLYHEYPQLTYPDFPECPARDDLLGFVTEDGLDLVPAADGIPDYFTCDGIVYCPDGRAPIPAGQVPPIGTCASDRFDSN